MRIGNVRLMSPYDNMSNLVKIMTKDKQFMQAMENMPVHKSTVKENKNHVSLFTVAKNYIKNIIGHKN